MTESDLRDMANEWGNDNFEDWEDDGELEDSLVALLRDIFKRAYSLGNENAVSDLGVAEP